MGEMKEVWHYVHNLENFSGAAFQGERLAREINSKTKFNCSVINKSSGNVYKKKRVDGLDVIHVPANFFLRLLCLLHVFLTNRVGLLHIHGYEDAVFIASLVCRKKVFLKSTIIGEDFESLSKKRTRLFLKLISRVAYNNALSTPIYDINRKYTSEISVIPNFIDSIERVSLSNKDNLFLVVGAVCSRKRTYESISYYIENLSKEFKGARLLVVGPNCEGYGEFDRAYVERCEALIWGRDDIKMIGQLDKSKVISLMRQAKAVIFLSSREGFGNVITESLSMSCVPIVSADNEVAHDIVKHRHNGYILKSFSEKIAATEIDDMIGTGRLYNSASKYLIGHIVKSYDSIYSRLLC